jgi:hypothetical protein
LPTWRNAFESRLGDREILNREAGAVEQCDVSGATATVGLTDQHGAQLGDVRAADDSGRDASPDLSYFL